MKEQFSKPGSDVAPEFLERLQHDQALLDDQKSRIPQILQSHQRADCLLCKSPLDTSARFMHRSVSYLCCAVCDHWQTECLTETVTTFTQVYPELTQAAYESRRNRIYQPKLDWVMGCAEVLGKTQEELRLARWLELGSGAGYFVSALKAAGIPQVKGLEQDEGLVRQGAPFTGEAVLHHTQSLAQGLLDHPADVVASFFVLEHVPDPAAFWEAAAQLKKGTVLVLAVPVVGLGVYLESAFDHFFARNLDSVLHTQMYTDLSLSYALDQAGFEVKARWTFGQDAQDLWRMILTKAKERLDAQNLEALTELLLSQSDDLQAVLDKAGLSDSRHVLAIKR